MAIVTTTSRLAALAMAGALISGCSTTGFGSPIEQRDYRSQDWRLIGITGTSEVVLREGLKLRACERLGREYHKKRGAPGWGVHEQLVCR